MILRIRCEFKKPVTMKTQLTALFVIVSVAIFSFSCNPVEDTVAEVRVVTPNGTPVPGAEVRMFGQGTIDETEVGNIRMDDTEFTDANGLCVFDYTELYKPGQSGFVILNVEITKEFPDSIAFVEGIMKIVEEETTRKTFRIE